MQHLKRLSLFVPLTLTACPGGGEDPAPAGPKPVVIPAEDPEIEAPKDDDEPADEQPEPRPPAPSAEKDGA